MTYQQTVDWMFKQLPMYQLQGASAYKKDLTNTLLLMDHLGHPEKNLRCIHVAGTNGKGSTSHMIASVLQAAGYKIGLYTSPHLKDFRERIKINGEEIPESFVQEFVGAHRPFFESNDLSFFEMSVGLAFDYFKTQAVDFAVIETGLGGRLDSTNVITPLVSVITNIGFDHTQFLGNTLELIAAEKAGIIKYKVPVIIGEYSKETKPVFLAKAQKEQAPIFFASDLVSEDYASDLLGDYQFHNKKTVVQTFRILQQQLHINLSEAQLKEGLLHTVANTGLLGRWQQLGLQPKIICDTAHNKEGLSIVMRQLGQQKFEKLHLVFGVVNDKDLSQILPLLPKKAIYYFCKPNMPRGLEADLLNQKGKDFELFGSSYDSVRTAYEAAQEQANPDDLIYVGGSTFVVAEIL
ncbi:MAG TPA: folylpolyglutamate synthase/dihydrofolate synthase family protein [Flavobacterium sp.]|nr:folylpolyglutamate synthase/dihydrofolate synthase family protein [Flavobacterium sp.]